MSTEQIVLQEGNGKPLIELKESRGIDPIVLLQQAMEKSPEALQLVREFVEWYDATAARKAYVKAMNVFKANPPEIKKTKHVAYDTKTGGKVDYWHTELDHACEMIVPALASVGISHRWETAQFDGIITVTCVLTHDLGHSERTVLQGLPDDTGSKNKIQAVGSTVTYLERYTLLAAVGLAAENQDDDGRGGIKLPDFVNRLAEIYQAADRRALTAIFSTHFNAALEAKDEKAMLKFTQAKDERKEQLPK